MTDIPEGLLRRAQAARERVRAGDSVSLIQSNQLRIAPSDAKRTSVSTSARCERCGRPIPYTLIVEVADASVVFATWPKVTHNGPTCPE